MQLKKQSHPLQKDSINESVNFRQAVGFSFDFTREESGKYLAATEEGNIVSCSRSYTDQQLESYFGHNGTIFYD